MSDDRLFEIVDQLVARSVRVAIIGGHAVSFHGYVRATEDVDIVFHRDPSSEVALAEVLRDHGAYWIGDDLDPETGLERTFPVTLDYIRGHHLMMLGTDVGYLDVFDFLPGLPDASMDDFFASVRYGLGRPFASLDWLKRMKSAASRPQDRIDLENLP